MPLDITAEVAIEAAERLARRVELEGRVARAGISMKAFQRQMEESHAAACWVRDMVACWRGNVSLGRMKSAERNLARLRRFCAQRTVRGPAGS